MHFPLEIMWVCVRWYAAYPLSLRHLEEMMAERGVLVDHATVNRWALKMLPVLAKVFRRRKHQWVALGGSMRVCHEHRESLWCCAEALVTRVERRGSVIRLTNVRTRLSRGGVT